ncbi:lysozyme [Saccharopolyspora cebuensis]|uniref:Lysozyme n=1 Tax=Saccharopolyspora cebuensis TaxID=418759 RepID=A0ABV4CDV8_9PSEU
MARPQIPEQHRGRRALRRAVASAAALLAALAFAAPAVAADQPATPRLDPDDPRGAWAGYSVGGGTPAPRARSAVGVAGMDVSGHQPHVDWQRAWADGARFAYVKATEGTGFRSSTFDAQYRGSYDVGMVRGAYHFALPDRSSGAAQAHYFVDNGGAWTPDGRTLPGALDIEHNPYGQMCYGLDPAAMSRWIADFSNTYHSRTGRFPVIYTTASWWNHCTGANPDFGANNPLWMARYAPQPGELPAGWTHRTIWQHSDRGVFPGCQDAFNGDYAALRGFAS